MHAEPLKASSRTCVRVRNWHMHASIRYLPTYVDGALTPLSWANAQQDTYSTTTMPPRQNDHVLNTLNTIAGVLTFFIQLNAIN